MTKQVFDRSDPPHIIFFTISILQETADEYQVPLWAVAVDFQKAFDSVTHRGIWDALVDQGVDEGYIRVLRHMYRDQKATVKTDRASKEFQIQRGTKQGDPLSSLLFNSVSEYVIDKVKTKWIKSKIGVPMMSKQYRLTNLRFADDILLLATSLRHVKKMIGDLQGAAEEVGLVLHPKKTKVLHNSFGGSRKDQNAVSMDINGMDIEILPISGHTKYLGRELSFSDPQRVEIENRIAAAWRKFYSLKQELVGRRYSLKDRMRLFHGVLTPTLLYGCEAWTMTVELENRVRRTQRHMLKMIIRTPRRK